MSLYDRLYQACVKRFSSELQRSSIQVECNKIWKDLKKKHSKDELERATEEKIVELQESATKRKAGLFGYFAQLPKRAKEDEKVTEAPEAVEVVTAEHASTDAEVHVTDDDESEVVTTRKGKSRPIEISDDEATACTTAANSAPKPRQDALKKEIAVLESELNSMLTRRNAGMGEAGLDMKITKAQKELESKKHKLKEKEKRAKYMSDVRARQKHDIEVLKSKNPDVQVSFRSVPGRPQLETDQPGLLEAISDIAIHGSSAADRRRSEMLHACKTLRQMRESLCNMGFKLSVGATYLRFLPRSSASTEGKRHVSTVPVKLCQAQSDLHRSHPDQEFCKATIYGLEEVASILGPDQVIVISQDDKAKVSLGKTEAKLQAPVLMHLNYKVRLSDHDFSVGSRHLLTPSVYAGIIIKENCMGRREAVSYSGPTYIAVRSAKHSSSTATTHAKDLDRLFELPDFEPLVKTQDGKVKPVLMLSVDGGPDENPRYKKVISHAIHFLEYDLDAVFIFTNAPGRSAFNRVERRMAPLSRELSTVVLPYDRYGSHLNSQGETTDLQLEMQNFKHAGETLAEIWSQMVIDGSNVTAEYIAPGEILPEVTAVTDAWYSNHIRESQYLLQVVKCEDLNCCSPHRSNLRDVLFQRFLPAPYPLSQKPFMIPLPEKHNNERFPSLLLRQSLKIRPEYSRTREIPYDYYCPSQREDVQYRICTTCGLYFASQQSMKNHRKALHGRGVEEDVSRVRPLRVLSQRPGELLCVFSEDSYEWIDVEDADTEEKNCCY